MKKDDLEKNDILCRTWETIKRRWWYIVLSVSYTHLTLPTNREV